MFFTVLDSLFGRPEGKKLQCDVDQFRIHARVLLFATYVFQEVLLGAAGMRDVRDTR